MFEIDLTPYRPSETDTSNIWLVPDLLDRGAILVGGTADSEDRGRVALDIANAVAARETIFGVSLDVRRDVVVMNYSLSGPALYAELNDHTKGLADRVTLLATRDTSIYGPSQAAETYLPQGGLLVIDGLTWAGFEDRRNFEIWLDHIVPYTPDNITMIVVLPDSHSRMLSSGDLAASKTTSGQLLVNVVRGQTRLTVSGRNVPKRHFHRRAGVWCPNPRGQGLSEDELTVWELLRDAPDGLDVDKIAKAFFGYEKAKASPGLYKILQRMTSIKHVIVRTAAGHYSLPDMPEADDTKSGQPELHGHDRHDRAVDEAVDEAVDTAVSELSGAIKHDVGAE